MKGRDKQTPEVTAADTFHGLPQFPAKPTGFPHAGDPHSDVALRRKAEVQIRESEGMSSEKIAELSPETLETILHELRVHQIELEIQNEELRRVQAALEIERARYFHIFDLAPVGYVTINAEGLIMEANLTAANLLGIEQRQLTGKTLSHFILRDDQDIYSQLRRQLANSGRTQTCEVRMGKTADTAFWALLSATTVPDPDGGPNCRIVLSDISERRLAEDTLRESEQEFIMLAESVPQMVWMSRPDGWHIYFNQQWVDYTGLTLEESYGHGWSTPFHPDDRQRARDAWQKATQKDVPYALECRLRCADGGYRWWLIRGTPRRNAKGEIIRWFGTCTDIGEIKAAEAALAETKAFLQAAMDQSSAGIAIAEAPSGKLSYVNRAGLLIRGASEAEALTGVDAENYVASWKLLHLDGTPMETEEVPLARAVLLGEESSKEFIIRRSANEDRIVLANATPIMDGADRVTAGIVVFQDITERKQMEIHREIRMEILAVLIEPGHLQDTMQHIVTLIKKRSGFDAVGLRMMDGEDFPYFAQDGFSKDFLRTENTLLQRNTAGGLCRDCNGNACLEGSCGLVISGRTDPSSPFCTPGGSFWTNHSSQLLDLPPDQDTRHHPRNLCIHHGYASVALVPVRTKDGIVGLLQLNDHRPECFSPAVIQLFESIAAHIGDSLMRVQAENKAKQSHDLLANLARLVPGVVYQYRLFPDGRSAFPYSSPGMNDIYEVTPAEVREDATPVFGRLHPDDYDRVGDLIQESARTLRTFYCEFRVILPRQGLRWRWSQAQPERMEDGGTLWHGIISDITERKRDDVNLHLALEEKTALVQEIHHRVKNNLAIMVGLINMQAHQIKHPEALAALTDTKARLFSMSLLHEMLYSAGRMDQVEIQSYIQRLCGHISQSHGLSARGIQIQNSPSAPLKVGVDQAVPCGLIISELISNTIKHAFPNDRQGKVTVDMVLTAPDIVTLRVTDDGIGLTDDHLKIDQISTLGLSLVDALTRQLRGTLVIQRGLGTTFEIRFPLEPTVPA